MAMFSPVLLIVPLYCNWRAAPDLKGLISSLKVAGVGVFAVILNFVALKVVNPNDL